ncbi:MULTISPECIES: papain-like cysteine protease family protein [unclassified Paenibacillus]|uniref:papain-like cysteine protease family protein n=1 Tax=unclassified Paenibacillus TaxID=185978 RepID=UPI00383682D4
MNHRKKLLLVLPCLLLSFSLFASSALAYVNYKNNSVSAQVQQKSNWCWAAVSSMLANYLGANVTQSKIVTKIYGSPVNNTGTVYDMKNALANWNVESTPIRSKVSFGEIISNIDNNMNLNAAIAWTSGGGHALLIKGYYQDTSRSIQNVYYINPGDGSATVRDYNEFVSNSSWDWRNTLSAVYVN